MIKHEIPDDIAELVSFQNLLFSHDCIVDVPLIEDLGFAADSFVMYLSIRPFQTKKLVESIHKYINIPGFIDLLVPKSIISCPYLLYIIFNNNLITIDIIQRYLKKKRNFLAASYFYKQIPNYKIFGYHLIESHNHSEHLGLLNNFPFLADEAKDELIKFGYPMNSVEYMLKYDDIESFRERTKNPGFYWKDMVIKSVYDWINITEYSNLLSFSAIFGSIKCFKYIVSNGVVIDDQTVAHSLYSGSTDLIRLISNFNLQNYYQELSYWFHEDVSQWIIDTYQGNNMEMMSFSNLRCVLNCTENQTDLRTLYENGLTFYEYSIQKGYYHIFNYLNTIGSEPIRENNNPLLIKAAMGGCVRIAKYLLNTISNVNVSNAKYIFNIIHLLLFM